MTMRNYLPTILLIITSFISTFGQAQSQYDKGTPPQLTAGVSSLGSYMSTELGTVNLSNGGLNINIPLGTVGGRGNNAIENSYSYDALNRLSSVTEQAMSASGGWVWQQQLRQAYTYDRYGNRTIDAALTWGVGINNKQFTVNAANNRLGVPVGQSGVMSYDTAGNLTNDTYTGAGNRTYDAENKITSAWGGNNQAQVYGYDSDGHRIKRTVDGVETWQVYGFGGELLAEYAANGAATGPQKEYGYRNGELLVTAAPELVSH